MRIHTHLRFTLRHAAVALGSLISLLAASDARAATLDVVGGQLVGAFDVDVGGDLYDVAFVDGTCTAVFTGCNAASDFAFQTAADAADAAQALLDQVFLDGGLAFDSNPALTDGCTAPGLCGAYTPFATDGILVNVRSAANDFAEVGDVVQAINPFVTADTSTFTAGVWAVWTPVPEPTTASLLAIGLAGLASRRRRARQGPARSAA